MKEIFGRVEGITIEQKMKKQKTLTITKTILKSVNDLFLFHLVRICSLFSTGISENVLMKGKLEDKHRHPQRIIVPSLVASNHNTTLTRTTPSFWPLFTMSSATCSETVSNLNEDRGSAE